MPSRARCSFLMVVVFSLVSTAALASPDDLTIVSQKKVGNDTGKSSTSYFSSEKYRHGDGTNDTIIDYGTGKITNIDHHSKQYWETTMADLQKQMQQMNEQLKNNPAAAQAMEKLMGSADEQIVLKKVDGTRKIAGYTCDHYRLTMGDTMKGDLWTTSAIQAPKKFFEAQKVMMTNNPMGQRFGKIYEQMKKLKGYPLAETLTFHLMGQTHETSEEATEVKKGNLPASTFAVPAGYTKTEGPMAKAAAVHNLEGRPSAHPPMDGRPLATPPADH